MTFKQTLMIAVMCGISLSANARMLGKDFYLSMNNPRLAYNNSTDKPMPKDKTYHVFADVDLVPTQEIQYAKPRIVIKSLVPKLVSDSTDDPDETISDFNQQVADLINTEADQFKENVKEMRAKSPDKAKQRNDLDVDFDTSIINTGDTPIVSIRFTFSGYADGLSARYRYHRVLNYNLDSGKLIELSDLFSPDANYLQVISDYSRAVLSKKLRNQTMIMEGTEPRADNFSNWNIDPTGLRFTFDESKVAPAIDGTQVVVVPYSVLNDLMSPDSPISDCLKHKRRCKNSNLRTGGFVDEAINTRHSRFNPILRKS